MEGLSELIPFLVERGTSILWDNFLKSCKELKIFAKKPTEVVNTINNLLNEPKTRYFGLRILQVYLTQCPKSIIFQYIKNWFDQSLKGTAQSSESVSFLSFTILRSLLEESIEFPDVHKHTSQVFVPKILEAIIKNLNDNVTRHSSIFQCLIACLSFYGKSCGNHRGNLENILINLIIEEGVSNELLSTSFHLLAQSGPSGKYKQNWHSQYLTVTNSLHDVLDQLFSDVSEILGGYGRSSEKGTLKLPIISDEFPLIKCHKLGILFSGLCQFVESMLIEKFPVSKKIEPEAIFGVVCRTLSVTCKSLETKISNSTYAVMNQICGIHISAIKLLNSLIICSRSSLLPFSAVIFKIFTQVFKSTDADSWLPGRERPYAKIRESSYKCLLTWLSVGKSCSLNETLDNIIAFSIIKDIKCEKKSVSLKLEQKTKSKPSKKVTVSEPSELLEMNAEVCQAALACIPLILQTPLSFTVVKNLQEVVVKLLFEIQRLLKYDNNLPPPYSNSKCRANLYSALLELCIMPHPEFPPPLHYANILFNGASFDCDISVHRICSHAINSISHLVRPCAPSFDFHVEIDSEVIPINPYPEPSERDIRGITKKALLEALGNSLQRTTKAGIPRNGKKLMVKDSKDQDIKDSDLNTVSLSSPKASDSNTSKSALTNKNACDNSIDLDNSSSDDSLILVDSVRNDNAKLKIASNLNDQGMPLEDEVCGESITTVGGTSSSRVTRSSNIHKDPDIELIEQEKISNLKTSAISVKKDLLDANNIKTPDSRNKENTDDIVILESLNGELAVSNDKQHEDQRRTRRGRSKMECNHIDHCKCDIIDLVEEPDNNIQTKSLKVSSVVLDSRDLSHQDQNLTNQTQNTSDSCSDLNNIGIETQLSDEISIIESPSCPRRSQRNSPSNTNKKHLDIEEINIIPDEDEPITKKRKIQRRGKFSCSNSANDKDKENDELICEIDSDDEMMNSFVDSVPE